MIEPQIKQTEPMTVAFLSMRGAYDQIPQAMGQLYGFVTASGWTPTGMPHAVYFTPPDAGPESEAEWELWAPVTDAPESGPDENGLGAKRVPPTLVASAMHKGSYEGVETTYRELGEWVAAEGYRMVGAPMEIYYSDPAEVGPEEYLTEIQFPVAKL